MAAQSGPFRSDSHCVARRMNDVHDVRSEDAATLLADQFAAAWRRGDVSSVDQFFAEHPSVLDEPEVAVRLIYEEFCVQQEQGVDVSPADVLDRFPQWRSKLAIVLDCHELVQARDEIDRYPMAGEQIGEFHLLQELGRGADGYVFLATQPLLSDRPVVVKITRCKGNEPLSLARLQHSSIVPLYLTQDHVERNLRLLCMPYLGGASLARILEMLADVPVTRRSGRHFVELLDRVHARMAVTLPFDGPALQFLAHATYVRAVCWIGAFLADALQYAHGRGLLHQDLKPSNVLLAGDGQPMLLDFHLARELQHANAIPMDGIGGTPGYMAPEQELAMEAVRAGRPAPKAMDGRADIFALGLLLYELLVGAQPVDRRHLSRVPLRKLNPSIPRSVDRIVRKCLAHEPEKRPPDAGSLAHDLRRTLIETTRHDRPHRAWFNTNKPGTARLSRPLLSVILAVVCLLLGYGLAKVGSQPQANTHASIEYGSHAEIAERARMANQLHDVVDRLRFLDATQRLPARRAKKLEAGCEAIWKQRGKFAHGSHGIARKQVDERIRVDLLDLAILMADLRVRLAASTAKNQARRDALRVLAQAETEFGPSVVLEHERRVYGTALDEDPQTDRSRKEAITLTARTSWEHYAMGRSQMRTGHLDDAMIEFQRSVEMDPRSFWPNFYMGLCAYRLRRFEAALAAFSACVALAPDKPQCLINRAIVYRALGRADLAARDVAAARLRDPAMSSVHDATGARQTER